MARTFGEMVDEGVRLKGWSDYQLSAAIGLLPGDKAFNPTQIGRLRRGERKNLSRPLVARLIDLLGLDPIPAWHAAGLWPEGLEPEDVVDLSERRAARMAVAGSRAAAQRGYVDPAAQVPTDQAVDINGAWRVTAGQAPVSQPRAA